MAFRNLIECFVCGIHLMPRVMRRIDGIDDEHKREIAVRSTEGLGRPPAEVDGDSRICINCNRLIEGEIRDLENDPDCLRLNVLKQTRNATCFICNAFEIVNRLSTECRVQVFVDTNIYIPESARCCPLHLDEQGFLLRVLFPGLQYVNRPYRMKGVQLHHFLQSWRELSMTEERKFTDYTTFSEEEFRLISPVTKEQFLDMFAFCDPVPQENGVRHIHKKDLLMFLCKLRQGLPDDLLKIIFNYSSRQAVSIAITTVRKSLMLRFVPESIGLNAITRRDYIDRHVTEFANELYNPDVNVPKVIAYIDGTYSYIPKCSNFKALRQSYCVYKGRHLVKPALIVAPDGYILDIHGPYFSDTRNNDAAMLRNEFQADAGALREWLGDGAILIVDRGYRDVLPLLENLGIDCQMPPLLQRGQRQFDTEEANESRLITKTRWIIEARNGHIRSIFKFFKNIISMSHVIHLREFYLIAGSIINRYREPILMEGATRELARTIHQKLHAVNTVRARVEAENLARRNGMWNHLNEDHLPLFPRLDLNYLKELTVGIYQINLAPAYIQDKLAREGAEILELDEHNNEPGFLRVRLYSRFRNATRYQLWIAYQSEEDLENDDEPILGYYCTCKSGSRTLGTCAHVASVLWYLSYARHQPNVKYPSTALLENITDAGNRQH